MVLLMRNSQNNSDGEEDETDESTGLAVEHLSMYNYILTVSFVRFFCNLT